MRKRLLLGLALLACVFLSAATVLWLKAPRHSITTEGFERIQLGMTEAEVESLLGGPAADYGPPLTRGFQRGHSYVGLGSTDKHPLGFKQQQWVGDDLVIYVGFDPQAGVLWTRRCPVDREVINPAERVRNWLGW